MKERNTFSRKRLSVAILVAIGTPALMQLAHAGAGWGDSADIVGAPIKTPTYYANSPSGVQDPTACFTAPPSTGAFAGADSTNLNYSQPSAGVGCDTGTALRKFVDSMSGIPVAVADKATYPGSDYYEIAVVEYTQKMHSDLLNPTRLRGYVQIAPNGTGTVPLYYLNADGSPGAAINLPGTTTPAMAVAKPSYLGPIINSTSGTPTRLKFYNLLPSGAAGNLHLPVDETMTGAGVGTFGKYQQNRVEIHLHGGDNPWISDGTPHQWILPAADETNLKQQAALLRTPTATPADLAKANDIENMARGVGAKNVPDMPNPGPGAMTYYFPNGQSGRMMFYHDHTVGLTRLNVYSGVVAGYMVNDILGVGENHASLTGLLPPAADTIPLIIQDKTFVPKDVRVQDAKWNGLGQESDLWYPHVYETNQDPFSVDGTNPVGRWDWGNWFWPVFPSVYDLPTGEVGAVNGVTSLSEVSTTPEAFMDTPVVNGTAYPTMTVEPKAYRFRVLNGANDRFLNLGLYLAADKVTTDPITPTNSATTELCSGMTLNTTTNKLEKTLASSRVLTQDDCTEVKMVNFDSSYSHTGAPFTQKGSIMFPDGVHNRDGSLPTGGVAPDNAGIAGTGWGAQVAGLFPQGAPDPATAGPDIVQIGNEGGLLANPLVIPSTPLNYEYNKRSVTVLNVLERGLYLGNAERADVLIDFSQYAGKTLILYNDAPAPVPASDPRIDYYTGNGDNTGVGGAPSTKPGFGPNTRTIMQIVVAPAVTNSGVVSVDVAGLQANLPKAYASIQAKPVVPEPEFNTAFTGISPAARNNARIYTGSVYLNKYNGMSFTTPEDINFFPAPICNSVAACATAVTAQKTTPTATLPLTVVPNGKGLVHAPAGTPVSAYVESKAIQELFDPAYGRMNATLGVELPFTSAITQTTIPLGYVDPATETVADGETQFWKITHNGVDTHPVHFHLVNVQVINRIGWDGTIKAPYGDEIGWKETVKMNPLEDIVVAVRAKKPTLGQKDAANALIPSTAFGLPNSSRLMDPSQPAGSLIGFTQVDPVTGNPAVVSNQIANYGWEYVWHCHILGHEENDFMRPVVFNANELAPLAPTIIGVDPVSGLITWTDNATTEYAYKVVRTVGASTVDLTSNIAPAAQAVGVAPLANATKFTDGAIQSFKPLDATVTASLPTNVTSTSVTLNWTGANATGYNVYNGATKLNAAPIAATSYTVSGLAANSSYAFTVEAIGVSQTVNYTVTAVGAAGSNSNSTSTTYPAANAISAAINVTTAQTAAITAPTGVAIQRTNQTVATLSWTDASNNETSFQVQTSTNGGSNWANVGGAIARSAAQGTATGANLISNITVSNTTNALYRVNAINAGSTASSASVSLNDTVAPTAAVLATPTKAPLRVFGVTVGTTVTLSWTDTANNNATYTLQRSTNGGANWTNVSTTIAGNAVTATSPILGLTATTNLYRVLAVNSVTGATGVASNTVTIVTP